MHDLYEAYRDEMGLGETVWNPELELGINTSQTKKVYRVACIESRKLTNRFETSIDLRRQQVMLQQQTPTGPMQMPQEQVSFHVIEQGWK